MQVEPDPAPPALGFLMADITRLLRKAFRARLRGSMLTHLQARVLVYLSREPGSRQVDLAERLDMQAIALSRVITQLAEAGIVSRISDPHDRRARRLRATSRAQPQLDEINLAMNAILSDALQGVSAQDAATAMAVMQAMHANLTAIGTRTAAP